MACWLAAFDQRGPQAGRQPQRRESGVRPHRLPGHDLDSWTDVDAVLRRKQSNSSVAFGDDSLMKVLRKITPGVPDITSVHARLLTKAGGELIASLYGCRRMDGVPTARPTRSTGDHAAGDAPAVPAPGATAGTWPLAGRLHLFAEATSTPTRPEATCRGRASASGPLSREVHAALAERFPVTTPGPRRVAALADGRDARATIERSRSCLSSRPADTAAGDRFARLRELVGVSVQQIHGDLHLGQTLRTQPGLEDRRLRGRARPNRSPSGCPTPPWRDVAGMLRSFDYVPHVVERQFAEDHPRGVEQRAYLAPASGRTATRNHFLTAYAGGEFPLPSNEPCSTPTSPTRLSTRPSTGPQPVRPGWGSRSKAVARIGAA